MRQILVVANQSLGGEELKELVRKHIDEGRCKFTIVAPIEPDAGDLLGRLGSEVPILGPSKAYESGRIQAVRRLGAAIQTLTELGASAHGDTGARDPVKAVGDCLKVQSYDEIIVSTLPKTLSRWLHQDVPHRIQRKYKIPVTTVIARGPAVT